MVLRSICKYPGDLLMIMLVKNASNRAIFRLLVLFWH